MNNKYIYNGKTKIDKVVTDKDGNIISINTFIEAHWNVNKNYKNEYA